MVQDRSAGPGAAARWLAIEIGDWAPLGASVRLEIDPVKTVLVGRNGAGKSTILEGFWLAGIHASSLTPPDGRGGHDRGRSPGRFSCAIQDADGSRIEYEYRWGESWEERCWRPGSGQTCWRVRDGVATFADGAEIRIPTSIGVLNFGGYLRGGRGPYPPEIDLLTQLFAGMWRVQAGVPRMERWRKEVVVTITGSNGGSSYSTEHEGRIGEIATGLVLSQESESSRAAFLEFVELGRRLGAWRDVGIELYSPQASAQPRRRLATVTFDGVDIGLLADGTLRVAELLWALCGPPRRGTILIEEPETGVHPGLLEGILDTIDAYAIDRQLLISTHAPQVVSWSTPQGLRLVSRSGGCTRVRDLTEREVSQVTRHLQEQTLGEYVYSGAVDEDE